MKCLLWIEVWLDGYWGSGENFPVSIVPPFGEVEVPCPVLRIE